MSTADQSLIDIEFTEPLLFSHLNAALHDPARYDELRYGVIAMDLDGTVIAYNRPESELSGISPAQCVGLNFFTDVAPCTNNYIVAGRFDEETELDETIEYVFTLKMRPTRVLLRLLKAEPLPHQYLVVKRR